MGEDKTNEGLINYLPLSSNEMDNIEIHFVPDMPYSYERELLNRFTKMLDSTKTLLTISTLWLNEGGVMEAILKEKIREINKKSTKDNPITIRILFGEDGGKLNEKVKYFIDKLKVKEGFSIGFFTYQNQILSPKIAVQHWNHSKIIAVDNDKLLVGGINFLTEKYLTKGNKNPIHDVSLYIEKEDIAYFGHQYVTRTLERKESGPTDGVIINFNTPSRLWKQKPAPQFVEFDFLNNPFKERKMDTTLVTDSSSYIIGVGKDGYDTEYCSKKAMLTLIESAKKNVVIAHQSFSTFLKREKSSFLWEWENIGYDFCKAVGNALHRGVEVEIILAGYMAIDGYTASIPNDKLVAKILEKSDATSGDLERLSLQDAKSKFAKDGSVHSNQIPLHSKVIMADNLWVYVGSHNTYWNGHAEYGVIIKSETFYDKFNTEFCDKIRP